MSKYLDLSIKEIHELLVNKKIKPIDLIEEVNERYNNNELNAFISFDQTSPFIIKPSIPTVLLYGISKVLRNV